MYHYYRDSYFYWAQSKHHVTLELLSVCLSMSIYHLSIDPSFIYRLSIQLLTSIIYPSAIYPPIYHLYIHPPCIYPSTIYHLLSIHLPSIHPSVYLFIYSVIIHFHLSIIHSSIHPSILPSFCPCIYSNTQLSSTYFRLFINHPSIYQPSIYPSSHLFISIHPSILLMSEIQDIIHNKHSFYGRETPTSMSMSDF